jgi:voltage-gated potassium channel
LYEIPALIPLVIFGILENYAYLNVVFRLLRLIRLFRIIHLSSRVLSISSQTNNRLIDIILVSVMAVSSGALGFYFVEEQAPGTKVTNLGDVFWWAIVTVTTVGYGDIYPVTAEGKIIASILMVVGIGILGVLISTLGGSFIESRLKPKVNNIEEDTKKKINEKISKLELLNKDEFSFLISSITTLYTDLNRQKQKRSETLSCLKCKNICPEN